MAKRGRQHELFSMAVSCLRANGYVIADPPFARSFGQNVRTLSCGGNSENVLIQTRSFQPDSSRYLVGIVVSDLKRVDAVVLWFKDEDTFLMMPATFLRDILAESESNGTAKFTGPGNEQWRVNIHLQDQEFSRQGSDGSRFSLTNFVEYVKSVGE